MIRLSIIVVNWNVCAMLRDCLRSVEGGLRMPREDWELIVVDNASADDSVAMLRREFPGARLLANTENTGFGRANNQALPHCAGRLVLLLNPDTVVRSGALDAMADWLEAHPGASALGCRLVNTDGSFQRWTAGAFPTLWNLACHYFFLGRMLPSRWRPAPLFIDDDVREPRDVGWLTGACLLLRREALGDRIFDESFFMYGEDMELCRRLSRGGGRVVYGPFATVVHHLGGSIRQQTTAVQLNALKGPRAFFALTRGRSLLWLYDVIVAGGFLLRCILYGALSLLRPGHDYSRRAASSWSYFGLATQVLRGR